MTLPLDTCKALQAAGFPQAEKQDAAWGYNPELSPLDWDCDQPAFYVSAWQAGRDYGHNGDSYRYLTGTQFYACPNSDELLAAIQERWPDVRFRLELQKEGWCIRHIWGALTALQQEFHNMPYFRQPIRLLAALYIGLAGQDAISQGAPTP